MRHLLEIGPLGEIYGDGEIYVDPDLGDIDDALADPLS
jgi:hypothetical protein